MPETITGQLSNLSVVKIIALAGIFLAALLFIALLNIHRFSTAIGNIEGTKEKVYFNLYERGVKFSIGELLILNFFAMQTFSDTFSWELGIAGRIGFSLIVTVACTLISLVIGFCIHHKITEKEKLMDAACRTAIWIQAFFFALILTFMLFLKGVL